MSMGNKILTLRKARKWSQQRLAKMIGASGPIIGRYERGEMAPSVEVAKKLADVFNVTMDYFVDDTGKLMEIQDKSVIDRIIEIERLDPNDKNTIIHVIDSLLKDAKARKTYATQ